MIGGDFPGAVRFLGLGVLVGALIVGGLAAADPAEAMDPPNSSGSGFPGALPGVVRPRAYAVLGASVEGVLSELLVEEGRLVKSGEPVARLDDRLARAAVEVARVTAEGTAGIDLARAELTLAESSLGRVENANARAAIAERELDRAVARRDQAVAQLELEMQRRMEAQRGLEMQVARLARHTLVAPFDGRIMRLMASPGEMITKETPVLVVASLRELEAELHLPSRLYGRVEVGFDYMLKIPASLGGTVVGTLAHFEPMLDPSTDTFRCVFTIENSDEALPSGFTVMLVDGVAVTMR